MCYAHLLIFFEKIIRRGQKMRKRKIYLLILGLAILAVLGFGGKLFQKNMQIQEEGPVANEELLILGTADSIE
jgi:hypothetical protein